MPSDGLRFGDALADGAVAALGYALFKLTGCIFQLKELSWLHACAGGERDPFFLHFIVEIEWDGHDIDRLPDLFFAERGATPCFVRGLAALLFEEAEYATGKAVFAAVVDDAAGVSVQVFLRQELLFRPAEMCSQGRISSRGRWRRANQSISRLQSAKARCQRSKRKCSPQASSLAPSSQARWMTSHSLRSPRVRKASIKVSGGSFQVK